MQRKIKVLSVTWGLYYDLRIKELENTPCTGGGIVIRNLCEHIGHFCESFVMLGRFKLPAMQLDSVRIVDTLPQNCEEAAMEQDPETHVQYMLGKFSEALSQLKPDIVNTHGLGDFVRGCCDICHEKGVNVVCTSHLFIGPPPPFLGYEKVIEREKELYKRDWLKIIAVSTGMKQKILKNYPAIKESNVFVIPNGTDFKAEYNISDYKKKLGIEGKKLLICSGTILHRKNQVQAVRSFALLNDNFKKSICIIFCGQDKMNGELQELIRAYGMEKELMYIGLLSNEDMKGVYSAADGIIMPSYAEGLSIAALEGIAYGLPVIMFRDSECAEDLDDKNVCVFAEERSDLALADAIGRWYTTAWNKDYIRNYSKYFSMERMAEDYIAYYMKLITKNNYSKRS